MLSPKASFNEIIVVVLVFPVKIPPLSLSIIFSGPVQLKSPQPPNQPSHPL